MSRIDGVPSSTAGPLVKLVFRVARRKTARLTARETERMIEPLQMYAHAPRLMFGYGMLEDATAKLHGVDERLKLLAELKAATLTQCEYCIDIGSQIARRAGISDEQLRAVASEKVDWSALSTAGRREYLSLLSEAPAVYRPPA